jgi:hypothetical protein
MKKIRIGNNIKAEWVIEGVESLAHYTLSVKMLDSLMREHTCSHDTDGNKLVVVFKGRDQYALGIYTIVLEVATAEDSIFVIDTPCFELVPRSSMAGGFDDDPSKLKTTYGIGV